MDGGPPQSGPPRKCFPSRDSAQPGRHTINSITTTITNGGTTSSALLRPMVLPPITQDIISLTLFARARICQNCRTKTQSSYRLVPGNPEKTPAQPPRSLLLIRVLYHKDPAGSTYEDVYRPITRNSRTETMSPPRLSDAHRRFLPEGAAIHLQDLALQQELNR